MLGDLAEESDLAQWLQTGLGIGTSNLLLFLSSVSFYQWSSLHLINFLKGLQLFKRKYFHLLHRYLKEITWLSLPHGNRYWGSIGFLFKKNRWVYSSRVLCLLLEVAPHTYWHATRHACVSYWVETEDCHEAALWFPKHHASSLFSPKLQENYLVMEIRGQHLLLVTVLPNLHYKWCSCSFKGCKDRIKKPTPNLLLKLYLECCHLEFPAIAH